MTNPDKSRMVAMHERTEVIRDQWGQPIGKRTYLPDGSVHEHLGGDAFGAADPLLRSLSQADLETIRQSVWWRQSQRQQLAVSVRPALVRARAKERRSNDQAGLATITWLPRSDGVRHGVAHLPRSS